MKIVAESGLGMASYVASLVVDLTRAIGVEEAGIGVEKEILRKVDPIRWNQWFLRERHTTLVWVNNEYEGLYKQETMRYFSHS